MPWGWHSHGARRSTFVAVNYLRYILVCTSICATLVASAQCCVEGNFDIRDFNVTRIDLEVTGAVLDDLSDPDQGVCRVSVEFQHQFLGDLIIELQSPSGRVVPLIGPGGTNGSGFTDFTVWDVDFVPCGFPADPDEGFDPEWDNDQAWGILGNYSGAYYPFLSCLETFNSGPVNGTWQLIITDTRQFDLGQLFKFRIEFCNGEGLTCDQCFECNAQAGQLLDTAYAYCSVDPSDSFVPVIVDSTTSDPEEFVETLLLLQGDTLVRYADSGRIDLDLAVGEYEICSFQYAREDSMFIPSIGDSILPLIFQDSLASGDAGYCADLGPRCVPLTIAAPPDTMFIREELCSGDTLDIGGQLIDSAGTYIASIVGELCDTIVALVVSENRIDREIEILLSDTCRRLTAFSVDVSGIDSVLWSLDDRDISRATRDSVTGSGELCLTVYDGACSSMVCDTISFGTGGAVQISGDTLLCPGDSILLMASSGFTDYTWSTGAIGDSTWVSEAGRVTLQARDAAGCVSIDQIVIEQLITTPVEINGDSLICSDDVTELQIDGAIYTDILWMPGDASSASISVDTAGVYRVSAIDTQGCQVQGVDTVTVIPSLVLDIENLLPVCAMDAERGLLDLRDAFISGDTVGVFSDIDASGAEGILPILDFEDVIPGIYRFGFTTSAAEPPCGEIRDTFLVEVFDCSCPILRITADTVRICPKGPSSLDLSDFLLSDSIGAWSIIDAPVNSSASIDMDNLLYGDTDSGIHLLTYSIRPAMASCRDTDSLYVLVGMPTELGVDPAILRYCQGRDTSLFLEDFLMSASDLERWSYSGPQGDISSAFDETTSVLSVAALMPGDHLFSAISISDGICPADTLEIDVQIIASVALQLSQDTALSCETQQVLLTSDAMGVTVAWSSGEGRILGDTVGSQILIQGPGTYIASASLGGGCSALDSVVVVLEENFPQGQYTASQRLCPGATDGSIVIDTVTGGSGVVNRFLDQVQIFTDTITDLAPGEYIFSYIDELGCTSSDTVVIGLADPDKGINITGDSLILPGTIGRYTISVESASPSDSIQLLLDGDEIDGPLSMIELEILRASLLTAILVDSDGCVYSDNLQIEIINPEQFYAPNVFSPNGDGVNDLWTLYALPDYWQITRFQIYDRWGNLMYQSQGGQPGEEDCSWDGNYRGALAPSDVYIYQVQLLGVAGQQRVLSGDLTLVR